jgi:transcription initiation factor TFIIE subunit alpha
VYKIDKEMQGTAVPANERKEYFCNFCKASWTQMEVLDNFSAQGFICHRCNHVLVHDAERHAVGHQKSTRMNNQFKFITDLLPQIDAVGIPEKTFDEAYANARVVERSEAHQTVNSVAVETGLNRPTAVKGLANTGPTNIAVSISTGDGPTEAEKAAEKERKERIAAQNELPSWMTTSSTNPEEKYYVEKEDPKAHLKEAPVTEATKKDGALDAKEQADVDDYFARLKAEQAAEAARKAAEEEEEYESGDEDEGDFEDVVGTSTNNSAVGTPASTAAAALGAPPVAPSPLRQSSVQPSSSLKREAPGSGTSTEATSPNGGTPTVNGPPAKKIKVEDAMPAPAPVDEDDEEEEDLEFEDV